jgi:AcrR family transcriptional regulator
MATQKQIEANLRNAQHSTGPRTQEGKNRVSLNALKHGLTAKTVVLPGEDQDAYLEKLAAWKADFPPRNEVEEAVIEDAVQAWWLRQRCRRVGTAQLARRIRHAASDFAFQQAGAALALGRRLLDSIGSASQSEHPELLVHQLESSYSGCDWLLDRWGGLRALLDRGQTWTPEHKLQAVTLLGKQVEHQDHELIMALAPSEDPKAQLTRQGLIDTYFDQPIPENQAAQLAVLRRIVERTTSRLELLLADHKERLDADVEALGDVMGFDASDEAERLRRYEQSSGRDFYRAINSLLAIRRTGYAPNPPAAAAGTEPASAPPAGHPDEHIPAAPAITTDGFAERPARDPEETPSPIAALASACAAAAPPGPDVDAVLGAGAVGAVDVVRADNVVRAVSVVCAVLALWAVSAMSKVGVVRVVGAVNAVQEINTARPGEAPSGLLPNSLPAGSRTDKSNPISPGNAGSHLIEGARRTRPGTTNQEVSSKTNKPLTQMSGPLKCGLTGQSATKRGFMDHLTEKKPKRCSDDANLARREEILETATELFAEHGFSDAVTQALAERLGVGKGTIYRHFPSKRELFLAAADRVMRKLQQQVDLRIAGISDGLERIERGIATFLQFFADHPSFVELLIQERAYFKDRKRPTYFEYREVNIERWRQIYRDLIAAGQVRAIPVEQITTVVGNVLYGIMVTNFFNGQPKPADVQAKEILDIIFVGILTDPERRRRLAGGSLAVADGPPEAFTDPGLGNGTPGRHEHL